MNLFKKRINKIILHTAEYRGKADVETIRRWHLEKGWDDIGYHYVITGSMYDYKAEIQPGRDLIYQGAHAFGCNGNSIGICLTGHGDHMEWTEAQMSLLRDLVYTLRISYDIPYSNIIGHRETWYEKLHRNKTCPGKLIDMNEIRKFLITPK